MTTCERCGDDRDEIMDVCHSCAARLVMWLEGPRQPIGQWRRRACRAMRAVVCENRPLAAVDPAAALKLVDAAYPFGERAMHPYKAWLAERKLLVEVLTPTPRPPEPTAEDHAACFVAIDLVEMGREDEARKLLDEQAPRRLSRVCPACGAKVGRPCFDLAPIAAADLGYSVIPAKTSVDRIVPHLARVAPQQPAPMPLFDRSTP